MEVTTTQRAYLHLLDGMYIKGRNTFPEYLALSVNVFAFRWTLASTLSFLSTRAPSKTISLILTRKVFVASVVLSTPKQTLWSPKLSLQNITKWLRLLMKPLIVYLHRWAFTGQLFPMVKWTSISMADQNSQTGDWAPDTPLLVLEGGLRWLWKSLSRKLEEGCSETLIYGLTPVGATPMSPSLSKQTEPDHLSP